MFGTNFWGLRSISGNHMLLEGPSLITQHIRATVHEALVLDQPQRPLRPGVSGRDGPVAVRDRMSGVRHVTVKHGCRLTRGVKGKFTLRAEIEFPLGDAFPRRPGVVRSPAVRSRLEG